jgi:hypothetical protein
MDQKRKSVKAGATQQQKRDKTIGRPRLLLVACRLSSSNFHHFRVNNAVSSRENRLKVEIGA